MTPQEIHDYHEGEAFTGEAEWLEQPVGLHTWNQPSTAHALLLGWYPDGEPMLEGDREPAQAPPADTYAGAYDHACGCHD